MSTVNFLIAVFAISILAFEIATMKRQSNLERRLRDLEDRQSRWSKVPN